MKENKLWVEVSVVTFILICAVIVFTWPLALHMREAIPAGSEPPAVALFQLFSAEWTATALDQGKAYWDAPFFYPYQGAFAWCEPQLFSCILIWLIAKLSGFILAYNIVVILYLAAFGLTGYALARLLTKDRIASLWAGIWVSCGAYSLQQICALPLVAAVFPAGCIFFGFMYALKKQQGFFWGAALMYILTWFTCKQTAFSLTLLLPIVFAPFLSRFSKTAAFRPRMEPVGMSPQRGEKKGNPGLQPGGAPFWSKWSMGALGNLLLAIALVLILVLPYSLAQWGYVKPMGFGRSLQDVLGVFSLRRLFMPACGHWLTTHILGWKIYSWDIGVVMLSVIILAGCLGFFKLTAINKEQQKIKAGLWSMVFSAIILGFGSKLGVVIDGKNYGLYSLLFSVIPGLNLIRAPARLGMFVALGIAILSAPAFAYIRTRMKTVRAKVGVTCVLFMLLLAEMWTMPIALVFPDKDISEHLGLINWLKSYGKGKPLLELPLPSGVSLAALELEAQAMLRMLRHGSPIVNGYVSYCPGALKQLRTAMAKDPAGRGRRYIDAFGARYVLVHNHKFSSLEEARILGQALGSDIVYDDGLHVIYRLPENKQIRDIKRLLPSRSLLRGKIPRKGKIYSFSLLRVRYGAILITPRQDWRPEFSWTDGAGEVKIKRLRMRGSVIVDVKHSRLYFRLLDFPQGNKDAQALLLPYEEVADSQ